MLIKDKEYSKEEIYAEHYFIVSKFGAENIEKLKSVVSNEKDLFSIILLMNFDNITRPSYIAIKVRDNLENRSVLKRKILNSENNKTKFKILAKVNITDVKLGFRIDKNLDFDFDK